MGRSSVTRCSRRKASAEPLPNREFVRASVAELLPNPLEAGFHDPVHRVARFKMGGDLFGRQGSFEAGDQIGGGNHLDAEAADQLQGSAVYQRNIHDLVLRRVLHGHALVRAQHLAQLLAHLLPGYVMPLPSRKRTQMARFHAMIQLERLALRGNQVIPATRYVQIRRKTEYAVSDGIAAMVVIEEPRIDFALAQRGLNRRQIHSTIVLDCLPHICRS